MTCRNPDKEKQVYNKITGILSEHKLKIEISKRDFDDSYEIKNLLGVSIKVMVKPDMFAHKLCALMDRKAITWLPSKVYWYAPDNEW